MLHRTTPCGAMLGPKRRRPEVGLAFLGSMVLHNASFSMNAGTTSMEKNLSIPITVMVLFLITFTSVEFETHMMSSHGLPEDVPTGLFI